MKRNDNNISFNNKLTVTVQLINMFIGAITALICVIGYITIESIYLKGIIIVIAIALGVVGFVNVYNRLHRTEVIEDENKISTIELVNEENQIVKRWDIGERVSFLIGKNTIDDDVFIDLNLSIYSTLIEDKHAVLNYAAGRWYIEDLSTTSEVSIQKVDDEKKYRIVKDTPCELKKGDILFIFKVKLLLK